jgi:transmembrane sensor
MSAHHPPVSEEIQDAASAWLARRDRGLSAPEQDAYLEWLYANPLHGRAVVQLERVWTSLNKLEEWRPAHSAVPNPDLLAPRRPSRLYWLTTALAAAAAVALAFYVWLPARPAAAPHREAIVHPGPERLTLADGSIVELNQGAKVDVRFTPAERLVELIKGEAHFTVAKNPNRPFIVSAANVAVRAVGTAFSVARSPQEITVLVTEGKVRVDDMSPGPGRPPREISQLTASQRVVVNTPAPNEALAAQVSEVTPAEVERALSWQGLRLEFADMRLGDVVGAFNRYNRQQLAVADEETAAILVGGNLRADNVDGFVRLLDSSFGVSAFRDGNRITLRKTH